MKQKIEDYKMIWVIIKLLFKYRFNKYFISDLQKVCNKHKDDLSGTPEFYDDIRKVLDEWMYNYLDYSWRVMKR